MQTFNFYPSPPLFYNSEERKDSSSRLFPFRIFLRKELKVEKLSLAKQNPLFSGPKNGVNLKKLSFHFMGQKVFTDVTFKIGQKSQISFFCLELFSANELSSFSLLSLFSFILRRYYLVLWISTFACSSCPWALIAMSVWPFPTSTPDFSVPR